LLLYSNRQENTLENSSPCIITCLPPYQWNKYYSEPSDSQDANLYAFGEDEKLLLDEAEQSYNKIADSIANKCINEIHTDAQTLQVPDTQDGLSSIEKGGGNDKIFDTRDLSRVKLVYNKITFQVCSGSLTNDRSSRTDGRSREDKLDISSFL